MAAVKTLGRGADAGRRVLAIVDEQEITVVALDTGEVLSAHRIEPDRGYWRNTRLMTSARPTGVGRALATYEIPIEGRDEWLAAARRLA